MEYQKIIAQRYKIIKLLGEGGFSKTYLIEDLQQAGQLYALKHFVVPCDVPTFKKAKELFFREAKILQKLNHSQIPCFIGFFEENQELYLLQEFIDGHILYDELKKPQSEEYVIELLKSILKTIKYLHNNNIIHRDLNPNNIIRKKDGTLVLIDFGAVKDVIVTTVIQTNQPRIKTRICTEGYAPREQINGDPKFNSDIYALGIIAIQALTGLAPSQLPKDETGEIICKDQANISDNLINILEKMVKSNYRERYQSVDEVTEELDIIKENKVIISTIIQPPVNQEDPILDEVTFITKLEQFLWIVLILSSILLLLVISGVINNKKDKEKTNFNNSTNLQQIDSFYILNSLM